jgi:4-amino-4-deoxy-L-arabinose transferase-like glycosyltransferase
MYARGDWVTPTFNGSLFADKPPLAYWMMIGSFELWGVNEFAARLPAALCAILTAWATYCLGRRLFCPRVGLWAGLITVTSVAYAVSARAATLDSALSLLTTLAFLVFAHEAMSTRQQGARVSEAWKAWGMWDLIYALLGLAVLTKGPVGAVLPLGVMGMFLLIGHAQPTPPAPSIGRGVFRWVRECFAVQNFVWAIGKMRPLTGIAILAAVAIPWYLLVNHRTEGEFLRRFLGEQTLLRAIRPMDGHSGPIFYYLIAIFIGFFPWSVYLVSAWAQLGQRLSGHPWHQGYRFVLCWMGIFVVFWSLVSTKLPHYVLPAYPAFALAVGAFIDGWLSNPAGSPRRWGRNAAITVMLVGVGIVVALPIVAHYVLPGEGMLGLVGLILAVGGGLLLWEFHHDRVGRAMVGFTVMSAAFLVAMLAVAAQRVDRHQVAPRLVAEIGQSGGEQPLCTYRFRRPSLVYYAGHPVPHCVDDKSLTALLKAERAPWIITGSEFQDELEELLPGQLAVVAKCPKFAKRGEIVVLKTSPPASNPITAKRDADAAR